MERLKPALGSARTNHLPCRNAFGKTLQGDGPEIAVLEQAGCQFACARSNDYGTGLGGRLEASGQIGSLSDARLLLGGSLTEEVTDDDKTCCDPDAHLQRDTASGVELRHRLDKRKPRADCTLGIMLVRHRITEVRKHTVADVLRDETPIALDQFFAAAVIARD